MAMFGQSYAGNLPRVLIVTTWLCRQLLGDLYAVPIPVWDGHVSSLPMPPFPIPLPCRCGSRTVCSGPSRSLLPHRASGRHASPTLYSYG